MFFLHLPFWCHFVASKIKYKEEVQNDTFVTYDLVSHYRLLKCVIFKDLSHWMCQMAHLCHKKQFSPVVRLGRFLED